MYIWFILLYTISLTQSYSYLTDKLSSVWDTLSASGETGRKFQIYPSLNNLY